MAEIIALSVLALLVAGSVLIFGGSGLAPLIYAMF